MRSIVQLYRILYCICNGSLAGAVECQFVVIGEITYLGDSVTEQQLKSADFAGRLYKDKAKLSTQWKDGDTKYDIPLHTLYNLVMQQGGFHEVSVVYDGVFSNVLAIDSLLVTHGPYSRYLMVKRVTKVRKTWQQPLVSHTLQNCARSYAQSGSRSSSLYVGGR